jgi:hypothetical protein
LIDANLAVFNTSQDFTMSARSGSGSWNEMKASTKSPFKTKINTAIDYERIGTFVENEAQVPVKDL